MASKRKFKRDYIILEAKDTNFRYKERILPKAFAKVEINDEKSIVSLYVENLKCVKDGYRVVAIQSDYETLDLGKVVLSEQGKGEFVLNLDKDDIEIKGIALLYEKSVPLIGFKGSKIENYEEILFTGEDEYDEDEYEEYEEIEYIEIDDEDDIQEYEEIEYIEIDEDDEYEEIEDGYEEIDNEYEEIDDEYDDDEVEYEYDEEGDEEEYEEYDNVEETIERNISQQNQHEIQQPKSKQQSRKNTALNKQKKPNYEPQSKYTNVLQESKSNSKTAGALLMPRQIKKGLKYFNEVKPFVTRDIDDTRWWKIEISPTTLCGYTMPYLGYVNSLNYTMYSDAVMQSYKYRHYLFGVQYDEYNKRKHYIYAVPGHKNEQPDKGHTGFTTYQPCDTRNDSLGYWLCFIDSRTRRITK